MLKACMDLSTAEIKDAGALQEVVQKLCAGIAALPVGEAIMVPGGWDGNTGASTVVHLVERTAAAGLAGACMRGWVSCCVLVSVIWAGAPNPTRTAHHSIIQSIRINQPQQPAAGPSPS